MLEVQDITKSYLQSKGWGRQESVPVLRGISLQIFAGETLGLVGASGCGKTTLSRILMRLIEADGGSAKLDGQDLLSLKGQALRASRAHFQMVFQNPYGSLNPRLTIYTMLQEALHLRYPKLKGEALDHRIEHALKRVGLPMEMSKRYPHEFSGGQRQRLALARALAPEPQLLIADEPVSALDVSVQAQILDLFQELQDSLNLAMLFISHDLAVVGYLADRVAIMSQGQIVETGETSEVLDHPKSEVTQTLLNARFL